MSSLNKPYFSNLSFGPGLLIVLGAIYGFGNFGFLNLFGARVAFQAVYVFFTFYVGAYLIINNRFHRTEASLAVMFSIFIGVGGIAHGNSGFVHVADAVVVLLAVVVMYSLSDRNLIRISRIFVIVSFLLSSFI